MKMFPACCAFVFLAASILCFVDLAELEAGTIHSEDFNDDNGGYIGFTFNPLASNAAGPWTYGATGVDGSNGWSADGGEGGEAGPFEQLLRSPKIAVDETNHYVLEFDHSYNFEATWDGGVVMVSVNDVFTQVTSFLENGYNSVMQSDSDWGYAADMNGLSIFDGDSGGFVHSVADLGTLNAGDTIEIRFRGGWDWYTINGAPNWAIDNVSVSVIPEPSTAILGLLGLLGLLRFRRK